MGKKAVWRGGTLLGPLPPVMVSCGDLESPNIITIAWTGIMNSIPAKTYISVRPERYSYDIIKEKQEFVINLTTASLVRAADFCGVRSGRDLDKAQACGLTYQPATQVKAPVIEQSPINLECKVTEIIPLGSHDLFLAEILAVQVEETYIDQSGKLDIAQCELAAIAHGEYFKLGDSLGTFGFSVKKPKKKRKKKGRRPLQKK